MRAALDKKTSDKEAPHQKTLHQGMLHQKTLETTNVDAAGCALSLRLKSLPHEHLRHHRMPDAHRFSLGPAL
jgi:hypothetical protein